jgi:hypothetical protein
MTLTADANSKKTVKQAVFEPIPMRRENGLLIPEVKHHHTAFTKKKFRIFKSFIQATKCVQYARRKMQMSFQWLEQ